MLRLLALSLTLAVAASQKRCCFAPKAHFTLNELSGSSIGGKGYLTSVAGTLVYDQKLQKVAAKYKAQTGAYTSDQLMIIDYAAQVAYIIDERTGVCTKSPYPQPMSKCIPPDAKFVMSGKLGYADESISFNVWNINVNVMNSTMTQYISVSAKHCAHLGATILSHGELATGTTMDAFTTQSLINFSPNVDPSVFNLPSSCNKAVLEKFKREHHAAAIRLFGSFL